MLFTWLSDIMDWTGGLYKRSYWIILFGVFQWYVLVYYDKYKDDGNGMTLYVLIISWKIMKNCHWMGVLVALLLIWRPNKDVLSLIPLIIEGMSDKTLMFVLFCFVLVKDRKNRDKKIRFCYEFWHWWCYILSNEKLTICFWLELWIPYVLVLLGRFWPNC